MKDAVLKPRPARRLPAKPEGPRPTEAQFKALQSLFDYFNKALFKNELPQVILNLWRLSKAEGFFAPNRWANRAEAENGILTEGAKSMHEISLVPDYISQKPEWVMSVLVHEMCHLQRQVTGEPPRKAYHDKQWAEMMKAVGLKPWNTKDPEKEIGQNCRHDITPDGKFDKAFQLLPIELLLPFAHINQPTKDKKAKTSNKVKFTCPQCEANVWGKRETNVLCGDCDDEKTGRPQRMISEDEVPGDDDLDDDQDQDDEE